MDWQHPFVDVFKQFGVFENAQTNGKGQVSVVQDNGIGRRIIRLQGSISSNNCVQIPDPILGQKSLGLHGRYIYVEFIPLQGRYFTIHFEFQIKDRDVPVKFTVSNMFDNHKVIGNQLQIPYPKNAANKWTILILDVEYFISNFGLLPHSLYKSFSGIHTLKQFTICSSMNIRGIFTSNILYDWVTMPKQMLFKLDKNSKWEDQYQIAFWPTLEVQPQLSKQPLKEVAVDIIENLQKIEETKDRIKTETQKSFNKIQQKQSLQIEELVKKRDTQAVSKGVEAQDHPLQPYPIMNLHKVIGFTVKTCPDIRWGRQSETQKLLTYAAGTMLIQNNIVDQTQKFYLGHQQPISCLDVSKDGEWLVSGQSGTSAVIRLWKFNGDCLSAFATPYQDLINVAFSTDRKLLVSVGVDDHKREIIIIWGLQEVEQTRKPILMAKQTSSVNILTIKFSPVDNSKLMSCGHENIRFWRIKDGHLPGSCVVLNHHARNTTFAVFDFEFQYETSTVSNVYFGAKTGVLYKVNYNTQLLETQYYLHNQPISAVCISAGFCVTGSLDQYLRVWPLDFSEFYIEARHEGVITSLDISLDGLSVACGTSTGGLGILDISSHHYKTVIRSHTGIIRQVQAHTFSNLLITLSDDCTIRLWDIEHQDQVYEFTFLSEDKCTCISSFPNGMYFAAGFKSGIFRVFDIENTSIKVEQKYHDSEIQHISYSPQGTYLITSESKSIYKIFDVLRDYQPIKTIQYQQSLYNQGIFSQDGALIALIEGQYNIDLWDALSFQQLIKIQCKFVPKIIKWAENNQELICGFTDGRVIIYGIERQNETISTYFLREQSFMHKQCINDLKVSPNMKYLITVGQENIVKVWDYEFTVKGPGSDQTFVGHQNNINTVEIIDQGQTIVTAGGDEGIFVWKFHGYCGKNERYIKMEDFQQIQSQVQVHKSIINQQLDGYESEDDEENKPPEQELLEEEPYQQLSKQLVDIFPLSRPISSEQVMQQEDQFIRSKSFPFKPDFFKPFKLTQDFSNLIYEYERRIVQKQSHRKQNKFGKKVQYVQNQQRQPNNLPFKQYLIDHKSIKLPQSTYQAQFISGYNNETHDNIIWCRSQGWFAYTTQNLLVIEQLQQERTQKILEFPFIISVMYLDKAEKHIYIGSAHKLQEVAPILIYSTETYNQVGALSFHTTGVHQIAFTDDNKYIISVGNAKECTVAVWETQSKKLLTSSYTLEKINDIKISKYSFSKERIFEFATVGRDQIHFWAFTKEQKLEYYDVFIQRNQDTNQLEEITAFDYIVFNSSKAYSQGSLIAGSMQQSAAGSRTYTLQTEEINIQDEQRQQISFPDLTKDSNKQLEQLQQQVKTSEDVQKQQDTTNVQQLLLLGLQSGELLIMKYGEFKVIFRRHLASEIISIKIYQSAGKILITTIDPYLYILDLTTNTTQGFLECGFPFYKIPLNALVNSYQVDPLIQMGIFGLQNGSIYLLSFTTKQLFSLAASNGDYSYDISKPDTDKQIMPFLTNKIKQSKLIEDTYIVNVQQGGTVRIWNILNAELLTEYLWDKEIQTFFYDTQQKQVVFFLEQGQIKILNIDRLDIIDSYHSTQKQHIDPIDAVFGVFDSIPGKFILDTQGNLFYYEQLFKNQEFIIRLTKQMELPNIVEIKEQSEKKIIFGAERHSGVVITLQLDFSPGRQFQFGFTLFDQVNFLDNPHGDIDNNKVETKSLYSGLPVTTHVEGAKNFDFVYFTILDQLQYLYGRNYSKKQTVVLISLNDLPFNLRICDFENHLRVFVSTNSGQIEVLDPNQDQNKAVSIHQPQFGGKVRNILVSKKKQIIITMNDSIMNFIKDL